MTPHRRRSGSQREVLDEHGRPLRERIRRRRLDLGLTASELARRVDISPAYMTRIEKGQKVPGERVAVALARALGDDPSLYLAWVHGRFIGDPEGTLEGLRRVYGSDPDASPERRRREELEMLARIEEMENLLAVRDLEDRDAAEAEPSLMRPQAVAGEPMALPRHRMARFLSGTRERSAPRPATVEVVVLDYGADPDDDPGGPTIVLDRGLLPDAARDESARLFAYRLVPEDVDGDALPLVAGEIVVVWRRGEDAPEADRWYAVRMPPASARGGEEGPAGVRLRHVRRQGPRDVLVIHPGHRTDVRVVRLGEDVGGLDDLVLGRVVLTVRPGPGGAG